MIGVVAATHARAKALIDDLGLQNAITISTTRGARGANLDVLLVDDSAKEEVATSASYATQNGHRHGRVYRITS